jgi:hypothetical protein
VLALALLTIAAAYFAVLASFGWWNRIVDGSPFRETYAAITTRYMVGQPPKLAYETPIHGPPWAVPLEFPLYQWTVAAIVTLFHTPLEQTGRAVNIAFFLLTLVPASAILRELNLDGAQRALVLALALFSAFYVFWSRTFMIESTELFWSVAYCALARAWQRRPTALAWILTVVAGALAAAIKITTLVPFMAAVSVWPLADRLAGLAHRALPVRRFVAGACLAVIPLAVGACWTRYADAVKALQPFGPWLPGSSSTEWVFGGLRRRLDWAEWKHLVRCWSIVVGHRVILVAAILLGLAGRRRWQVLACAGLTLMAPLIFWNLHASHEYYSYANGLFLLTAVGLAVVSAMESPHLWWRIAGLVFLAAVIGAEINQYRGTFLQRIHTKLGEETDELAQTIQATTRPDDVLVILGFEWTPTLPYFCKRRAMMIPQSHEADVLQRPGDYSWRLRGYRVGALIVRAKAPVLESPEFSHLLRAFGVDSQGHEVSGRFLVFTSLASGQQR